METLRTQTTAKKLKKVLVLAHENSSHEAMVLVIDASGQAGIKEVSVADVQKKGGVSPAPSGAPPRVIRRN